MYYVCVETGHNEINNQKCFLFLPSPEKEL